MKDFVLNILKGLWTNHRKKLVAFLLGLLFAGLAAVTGIPLSEIQDAAKEAANKPVPVEQPAPATAPQALPAPAAPAK